MFLHYYLLISLTLLKKNVKLPYMRWCRKKLHYYSWKYKRCPECRKETCRQGAHRWYKKNLEKSRENKRNWKKLNKAKWCASVIQYKTKKLQAMPKWLTSEQIQEIEQFYILRDKLTEETGIRHHVDHQVPLRGKNISGLHVPWNLEILTEKENLKKNNKF
jgi:hypothetical protein